MRGEGGVDCVAIHSAFSSIKEKKKKKIVYIKAKINANTLCRHLNVITIQDCFVANNIHEKLLDSDWLRAVQCNTSANLVNS